MLARLNTSRFADKSVAQTWATLLDESVHLCSMCTMHHAPCPADCRAVRGAAPPGHPPRVKPELLVTAPGQVWSRDFIMLRGPERSVYYDCYIALDIFSRYVVGWTVAAREDAQIDQALPAEAMAVHGTSVSVR